MQKVKIFHLNWEKTNRSFQAFFTAVTCPGAMESVKMNRIVKILMEEGCYDEVVSMAISVEKNPLEEAYYWTQNLEESWTKGFGMEEGKRSSSMGDVFEKDGEFFIVAMVGFDKIDNPF